MANRRLTLRSIKEILRLRYELNLSHRKISASTTIALSTIMDIIRRAESLGITWPLPDEMDDVRLEERNRQVPAHLER